jgi:DNA (cytosine-5)-methyltransferase 1
LKPTQKLGRHLLWSNFEIPFAEIKDGLSHNERGSSEKGYFDLRKYKTKHRKDQIIRNCVDPNLGQYVFRCAIS